MTGKPPISERGLKRSSNLNDYDMPRYAAISLSACWLHSCHGQDNGSISGNEYEGMICD